MRRALGRWHLHPLPDVTTPCNASSSPPSPRSPSQDAHRLSSRPYRSPALSEANLPGSARDPFPCAPRRDGNSLEFAAWKQAVAAELAKLGYRVVENEVSAQVAELRVERARNLPEPRRGPVNVGVGGSTGSYGSGVGVGLGVDLSGPPPEVTDNRLRVVIKDNGTGQALWEGRAEFSASANSDYASAQAAANKMAAALFKGFPGESGTTIEVK